MLTQKYVNTNEFLKKVPNFTKKSMLVIIFILANLNVFVERREMSKLGNIEMYQKN